MGTVTRPTKILVPLAVVVLVGGIVALWAEWGSAALPDNHTLAARIAESAAPDAGVVEPGFEAAFDLWARAAPERPIVLNGWEFQLFDPPQSVLPPGSLTLSFMPENAMASPYGPTIVVVRAWAVVATPVTPMAKLRLWLGVYPGDWEPTHP